MNRQYSNTPSSAPTVFNIFMITLVGLGMAAFTVWYVYFTVTGVLRLQRELATFGKYAVAQHLTIHHGIADNSSYIEYEFTIPGTQHIITGKTTDSLFTTPLIPQNVIYSSRDPNISLLEREYKKLQSVFSLIRYKFRNLILDIVLVACFGMGIWVFVTGVVLIPKIYKLEKYGEFTEGVVDSLQEVFERSGKSSSTSYYAWYSFQVGSHSYYLKQKISNGEFAEWTEGRKVKVLYLPEKPTFARIVN